MTSPPGPGMQLYAGFTAPLTARQRAALLRRTTRHGQTLLALLQAGVPGKVCRWDPNRTRMRYFVLHPDGVERVIEVPGNVWKKLRAPDPRTEAERCADLLRTAERQYRYLARQAESGKGALGSQDLRRAGVRVRELRNARDTMSAE